jgi:hypothetical protein
MLTLLALLIIGTLTLQQSPSDSDHDGISDHLEQQLLEKFAPQFMLSRNECDGRPAELQAGSREPRV